MTNEFPVPTASPGAGSGVPSSPNSRRRTYSNRAGSFDASAISRSDGLRRGRALARGRAGSGPLGSSSGSTPSASIAGARSCTGLPAPAPHRSPTCGEAVPDVVDPEVLGLEAAGLDLVPRERRRDRRARLGPQRVGGGDVRALPVHVVVDEDLAGAVGDLPRHGHAVGVGAADHRPARADERPHLVVGRTAGSIGT